MASKGTIGWILASLVTPSFLHCSSAAPSGNSPTSDDAGDVSALDAASSDGALEGGTSDGSGSDGTPTPSCPSVPVQPAGKAASLALYPAPRYSALTTLGAKPSTACVDTAALPSHDALDALVGSILAEAGLKAGTPGSCACDWSLAFAHALPSLSPAASTAWSSAGSNPDRHVVVNVTGADGRATSTLYATSETAGLYALRAAVATLQSGRVASGEIVDWSTVAERGVVEGIYGPSNANADCGRSTSYWLPYRMQDRLELVRLLSRLRMNVFMYGPKCDDYSGPGAWSTPYPTDVAELVQTTARLADAQLVRFVWAIRPLTFFSDGGYATELAALEAKLDQLRSLDVRHFALFWDDSYDYAGSVAQQIQLMNDVDAYVKSKDPSDHLTVVGQPYCSGSSFCSGPDATTDAFGSGLHPDIEIFWTGPGVEPTTIAASDLAGIDGSYRRKVTIWDNWPCAGASYCSPGFHGRAADMPGAIQGYFANPVLDEYNGPALPVVQFFQVLGPISDYLWNAQAYAASTASEDASYQRWQPLLTELEPKVGSTCVPCGSYGAYWTCSTTNKQHIEFCDPVTSCLTDIPCPNGCQPQPAGQADICHF